MILFDSQTTLKLKIAIHGVILRTPEHQEQHDNFINIVDTCNEINKYLK